MAIVGAWQLKVCRSHAVHVESSPGAVCRELEAASAAQQYLAAACAVAALVLALPCGCAALRLAAPYRERLRAAQHAILEDHTQQPQAEHQGDTTQADAATTQPEHLQDGGLPDGGRGSEPAPLAGPQHAHTSRWGAARWALHSSWPCRAVCGMRGHVGRPLLAAVPLGPPAAILAVILALDSAASAGNGSVKHSCYLGYQGCLKSLDDPELRWPDWPDEASLPPTFLAGTAAFTMSDVNVCERTMTACASGAQQTTAWAHRIEVAWVLEVWLQVALALVLAPGVVAAWMLGVRTSLLWRAWWVVAQMHEHEEDAFVGARGSQQQLSEVAGQE